MTQYEMTEKLSEKCDVTLEEAKAALEAGEWNTLTATHLLEQEKFRRMQELAEVAASGEAMAVQYAPEEGAAEETRGEAQAATSENVERVETIHRARSEKHSRHRGAKGLGNAVRKVIACGNRNRFEVRKGDEMILDVPVTALALGLVFAFWVCVPLMVVGLFTGCRYSFGGKDLGRDSINSALARASVAADRVKESVARA